MSLEGSDKRVNKITLPTEKEESWRFGYVIKDGQYCISSVETPTGSREEVLYQDLGHQFPTGSGKAPLPRVTAHRIYPGSDQPMIEVRYTYPKGNNFVGFGLSMLWDDGGLDNLYKYLGEYEYQCVETLWVADEPTDSVPSPQPKPVRTIERKFNQFHLLTHETTTQNNNVQTVETTYHLIPNKPFSQQPNYCQLPKEVKTTWSMLNNVTRQRSEIVKTTYDIHGNLLTQTNPNGVVETSTWYPAADANDFVRRLKDKTVTPAASVNGNAPTLRTLYTYQTLPPLTGSPLADWYILQCETLFQVETTGETELQHTEYTYFNQPGDAFLHGRGERQTVTLDNKCSFIDYQYKKLDSPQLKVPVQQTTQTFSTNFDTASSYVTRQHSLLTSQELLVLGDDVEVRYTYDAMNRLTKEIVAPGTGYEAIREYEYTLSAVNGQPVEHFITNAKKIKTRVVLDGLARAIFEERDHVDNADPSRTRQTSAALYNAWGDLAQQTAYDWLDGKELALTTRYKYDDWAQQCTVIGPDGVEEHQTTDPIGTNEWKGPIVRSWRQSAGPAPTIVGLSETWLNTFGKPVQTRVLDAAEQEVSVETYPIYSTYVSPGPYEIDDLSTVGGGGELEIVLTETDGQVRRFTQSYATIGNLLREGVWRYSGAIGRYNAASNLDDPLLWQGTLAMGMAWDSTLYGGLMASDFYRAGTLGVAKDLGSIGALALDVTQSSADLDTLDEQSVQGTSYAVKYGKSFATRTNLRFAGYRYSTEGYRDFDEAVRQRSNSTTFHGSRRSRLETSIYQHIGTRSALSLTLSHQDYWRSDYRQRQFQFNFNTQFHRVSYNLYASQSLRNNGGSDRMFGLSASLPIDFGHSANATFDTQNSGDRHSQRASLGGSVDENRLNYRVSLSNNEDRQQAAALSLGYQAPFGSIGAGLTQGRDSRNASINASGAVLLHANGIELGPYLGETSALVEVPDVPGVGVMNATGVKTNDRGYALMPNLQPYRINQVVLQTDDLGPEVEIDNGTTQVVPRRGAVVKANFPARSVNRLIITGRTPAGQPLPFGAQVSDAEGTIMGVIGQAGQVMISTSTEPQTLDVRWGEQTEPQCRLSVDPGKMTLAQGYRLQELTSHSTPCPIESHW